MRAVVKETAGPGCRLVTDHPEPALRPGEVRVEVAAASVCGTDAAFYASGVAGGDLEMTFPRTMGHEVSGTVVEVGPGVATPVPGTRVAVETHLHCGSCWFCRAGLGHNCAAMDLLGITVDGAFAERVVVPARNCWPVPDEVGVAAATLLESAGSAVHGVLRAGVPLAGASVLVTGAGPVGLAAVQVLLASGAREVVVAEPMAARRARAAALGAVPVDVGGQGPDAPVAVADAAARGRGGFDLALECSGALPALETCLASVRREGTVVTVGLVKAPLSLVATEVLITRGLTLRGSWGRSIWDTWSRLTELVVDGRVDLESLVTHRLPLSGLPRALDLMRGDAGKVLLLPALPDGAGAADVE